MSELKELTPYQCKYERLFKGACLPVYLTPREKLAELIDDEWKYSRHWSDIDHDEWVIQVVEDLDKELVYANKRLAELRQARKILNLISLENKEGM